MIATIPVKEVAVITGLPGFRQPVPAESGIHKSERTERTG